VTQYLLAFAVVFAVNLLPAFGPPTRSVLVFIRLNSDQAAVPMVLGGALAAACGRYVLANGARRFRARLSEQRRAHLAAAEAFVAGSRRKAVAGLGLFALSPVPSAQLFLAAGLLTVPLLPLTVAFFSGRLVSYSIYVGVASLAKESFGDTITEGFASPLGIALQLAMLGMLVLLLRIDWAAKLDAQKRAQAEHQSGPDERAREREARVP
jgi:uncharacterized membrane protein YdjX (TVP38/TMEM64 family)